MGERRELWSSVGDLVRPHVGKVGVVASTSFLGGLVEAAFLVIVTRTGLAVADDADTVELTAGISSPIGTALALGLGLLVARVALALTTNWASTGLTTTVAVSLRRRLADAYLRASWATQQDERAGRLQQLVTGFASAAASTAGSFAGALSAGLSLAAMVAVSLGIDPLATIVVLVSLTLLGSLLAPLRRRIKARSLLATRKSMDFSGAVAELGSLGLEMQAFGVRDAFSERIHDLARTEADASRRADLLRTSIGPVYTSLAYAAILGALAVAAGVGLGQLSTIGAVMLVMLRSLAYGQQLQVASATLRASQPFLETLQATLGRYEADRAPGGDARPTRVDRVAVDHVSFVYPAGNRALDDVSFTIPPGEVVGVVGPSGSGKSTLVQLLLGLRVPTSGTVHAKGVDLSTIDRAWWTQRVAFVPQDAHLFAGTIAENIAFFREVTRADVETASRAAHLHPDIEAMPDGYDTQVGERGDHLSGGQRQRLSIARALLGRPEMIILDEPTSALDVRSESLIRITLDELRGEVTIIVIAHRLSTLDICDRIMVIQDGRLRAFDDPNVLASSSEFYREALELSGLA